MKTIYILKHPQTAILSYLNELSNAISSKSDELILDGYDDCNDDGLQKFAFAMSDILVTDIIDKELYDQVMQLNGYCNIVILASDINRAQAIVADYQKAGIYKVSFVNISHVDVNTLSNNLCDHEEGSVDLSISPFSSEELHNDTTFEDIQKEVKAEEEQKLEDSHQADDTFLKTFSNDVILESETSDVVNEEKANDEEENQEEETTDTKQDKSSILSNSSVLNEIREEKIVNITTNVSDLSTKVISLVSKKGGTGKSTFAKEMANFYSHLQKPKSRENYRVTVLDFDFESGSQRTLLGIDNPYPNIYTWINDILDKIEDGSKIDSIYFSSYEVMNYLMSVKNSNFSVLITNQGNLPIKILEKLSRHAEQEEDLLEKILKKIIKAVIQVSDIVIIDTPSNFDEFSVVAMENSNNILYMLQPTIPDIENFKVFVDEVKDYKKISFDKIGIVINNFYTKNFNDTTKELLNDITYNVYDIKTTKDIVKHFPIISENPFDVNYTIVSQNYAFMRKKTDSIITMCHYCLPMFRVNQIVQYKKQVENLPKQKSKKELAKEKKAKMLQEMIEAEKRKKEEKLKKKGQKNSPNKVEEKVADSSEKVADSSVKLAVSNDNLVLNDQNISENKLDDVVSEDNNENNVQNGETVLEEKNDNIVNDVEIPFETESTPEPDVLTKEDANRYLNSDLSNETLAGFVGNLQKMPMVSKTKYGYPIFNKKPMSLNKKVWKEYQKALSKELYKK